MEQRSVLISGCSSGIGRCVAEGLKARGYRVFATARKQQDVDALIKQGFESCQLDLADSGSIKAAVEKVLNACGGKIYGLFNNAGYGQPGAVEDITRDILREQFETNLFGSHELTRLVIAGMRKQGQGRIIQHSSVLGFVALKYRGAYNASKYALEGLTDTLRQELDGSGIYVSIINTGPVTSNFRENAYTAFKNNIDRQNSAHKKAYEAVERRLASSDDDTAFTLGPEAVLDKVILALESNRPKARYYVTIPTYVFGFLNRLLPDRLMDWVLIKASDAENK